MRHSLSFELLRCKKLKQYEEKLQQTNYYSKKSMYTSKVSPKSARPREDIVMASLYNKVDLFKNIQGASEWRKFYSFIDVLKASRLADPLRFYFQYSNSKLKIRALFL